MENVPLWVRRSQHPHKRNPRALAWGGSQAAEDLVREDGENDEASVAGERDEEGFRRVVGHREEEEGCAADGS